jgi:hypothetical protein
LPERSSFIRSSAGRPDGAHPPNGNPPPSALACFWMASAWAGELALLHEPVEPVEPIGEGAVHRAVEDVARAVPPSPATPSATAAITIRRFMRVLTTSSPACSSPVSIPGH